jgi:hypothetical protein
MCVCVCVCLAKSSVKWLNAVHSLRKNDNFSGRASFEPTTAIQFAMVAGLRAGGRLVGHPIPPTRRSWQGSDASKTVVMREETKGGLLRALDAATGGGACPSPVSKGGDVMRVKLHDYSVGWDWTEPFEGRFRIRVGGELCRGSRISRRLFHVLRQRTWGEAASKQMPVWGW